MRWRAVVGLDRQGGKMMARDKAFKLSVLLSLGISIAAYLYVFIAPSGPGWGLIFAGPVAIVTINLLARALSNPPGRRDAIDRSI